MVIRNRAELITDHLFSSVRDGSDSDALIIPRSLLPSHAAVLGNVQEVAVAVRRLAFGCLGRTAFASGGAMMTASGWRSATLA